jgi:competence protein ComEA helix-hairpin-helix repeat region
MKDKKKLIAIVLFIIILIITIIASFIIDTKDKGQKAIVHAKTEEKEILFEIFKVDIKGAVKNPGVYEVKKGDRIIDLINIAGGLIKEANTNFINLSKELEDEMIVWVYTNKEIIDLKLGETIIKYIEKECNCPSTKNTACINSNDEALVNINTADMEVLLTLSGIGESKAKAIIEYREKQLFINIEDIMNVSGIGESAFEKIKDYITV